MAARRRCETSGGLKGLKGGLLHETKAAIAMSWRSIYLARTEQPLSLPKQAAYRRQEAIMAGHPLHVA